MNETPVQASKRDKIIGSILLAIGLLWILLIAYGTYQDYTSILNHRTLVQAVIGGLLNALIPLLLVTSGQYYLSGKNAKRLAKKGKLPQPQTPVSPTAIQPLPAQPEVTSQPPLPQSGNIPSDSENQAPKQF